MEIIRKATEKELEKYWDETLEVVHEKTWLNIPWSKLKAGCAFSYTMKELGCGHYTLDWEKSAREIMGIGARNGVIVTAERAPWKSEFVVFLVKRRTTMLEEWSDEEIANGAVPNFREKSKGKGITGMLVDLANGTRESFTVSADLRQSVYSNARQKKISVACKKFDEWNIEVRLNMSNKTFDN